MASKSEPDRIVFILDVSRLKELKYLALRRIIADVVDNTSVGVVAIDSRTGITHNVTNITSNEIRDKLLTDLNQEHIDGIDIDRGIWLGLKALSDAGCNFSEAVMVLVIDSCDRNGSNYLASVQKLIDEQIKVICVTIDEKADENLEKLVKETRGNIYHAQSSVMPNIPRQIEAAVHRAYSSKHNIIPLYNEIITIGQDQFTKEIIIDSDIGKNTAIMIGTKEPGNIEINIIGHADKIDFAKNTMLERCEFKNERLACAIYTLTIKNNSSNEMTANMTVRSEPSVANPILMNVYIQHSDVYEPSFPIIIVELYKGDNIIVGAKVVATIDRPDGSQSEFDLKLYDNIYCKYFTEFTQSGRYNVSVVARNDVNSCYLQHKDSKDKDSQSVQQFQRQQMAGSFKITECMLQLRQLTEDIEQRALQDLSDKWSFNATIDRPKRKSLNPRIYMPTAMVLPNETTHRPFSPNSPKILWDSNMNKASSLSSLNSPSPLNSPSTPKIMPSHSNFNLNESKIILPKKISENNLVHTDCSNYIKLPHSARAAPKFVQSSSDATTIASPDSSKINVEQMKESLQEQLLCIRKTLNSSRLSEAEKKAIIETINEIKNALKHNENTWTELNKYCEKLERIKDQHNLE